MTRDEKGLELESTPTSQPLNATDADELDLRRYAGVLWRYRWGMVVILILTLGGAFVRTMFLVPEIFQAKATLLPYKEMGTASGALSALQSLGNIGSALGGFGISVGANDRDRLVNVLNSRSLLLRVASEMEIVPHLLRKRIEKAQKSGPTFPTTKVKRVALELIAAHPRLILPTSEDEPDLGILSMTDATLRQHVTRLEGIEGEPDEATLREIRTQWHRATDRAIEKFARSVTIQASRQELISVTVEIPDSPELAAHITNHFVARLDDYLLENTLTQSRQNREFLEQRVAQTVEKLTEIGGELETYKTGHRLVSLPDQLETWVRQAGEAQAQLEARQVALEVLRQSAVSSQNPRYKALTTEVQELTTRVRNLEEGRGSLLASLGLSSVPRVERELSDLMREKVVQETLFTILVQQYEMAKIQEEREQPRFQSLDAAQPPARKSRPKRAMDMVVGAAVGFLLALGYAFTREWARQLRSAGATPPPTDAA